MSLKVGTLLPTFEGVTEWIIPMDENLLARGNSILIHFWSVSCPLCHENIPAVQRLRDTFTANGLQVVAIHCPRGPQDLDVGKLKQAVAELGIVEACAVDNTHAIVDRFSVSGWPAYFLFDQDKRLRRHALGQFGVRMIGAAVERMFSEKHESTRQTTLV